MAEEAGVPKGYKYIGMGLVAENKPLDSKVILYTPVEETPKLDGDLVSENQRLESKYVDSRGQEQTATLYTNSARDALWLPDDSFRLTAPDVRRGEQVRLYRYADSQTIYWKEMGTGKRKRRGETVILGASGRIDMADSGLDEEDELIENHYRVEFSGHRRIINLTTSKANGEKSLYSLLLDGGNGLITLGDAEGNEFVLNTEAKQWGLRNSEGTYVVLDKKNLLMGAEENILIEAGENLAMEAKNVFITCKHLSIEAETIKSKATTWDHTGDFNVLGNWSFTGKGKSTGDVNVTGTVTADKDVKSGDISLRNHKHQAQGSNSITTEARA